MEIKTEWLLCPVCKNKTRIKLRFDTELKSFPLYCRLSVEDMKDGKKNTEDESNSISNQKQILLDYCKKQGYKNTMFFVDDGISGTSFGRSRQTDADSISVAWYHIYIHTGKCE